MIQDNIYARTQPSNLNQTNWDSVFLFLNDDALIDMANDPKGKSIDQKRYSLVQSVLTYPKTASEGISQRDLNKAQVCAKKIKFNVSTGVIRLKRKNPPSAYIIGLHPGSKHNPSI